MNAFQIAVFNYMEEKGWLKGDIALGADKNSLYKSKFDVPRKQVMILVNEVKFYFDNELVYACYPTEILEESNKLLLNFIEH